MQLSGALASFGLPLPEQLAFTKIDEVPLLWEGLGLSVTQT